MPEKIIQQKTMGEKTETYSPSWDDLLSKISVRDQLIAMKRAAEIYIWRKFTDKKVYLAHLRKASERYSLTYNVSVRELAEIAYITKNTVSRCNKRLEAGGFLVVSNPHEKKTILANEYTLTPNLRNTLFDTYMLMCIEKEFSHNSPVSDYILPGTGDPAIFDQIDADYAFDLARNDCFRNGLSWVCDDSGELIALVKRLGGRCPEIFAELLHRQLQTAQEISGRIGCHVNVTRNALKKLMRYGLVSRTKTKEVFDTIKKYRYYAPTNYDLYEVEIATHTVNKIAKVKKKHNEERNGYYDALSSNFPDQALAIENQKLKEENEHMRAMLKEYSQNKKEREKQTERLKVWRESLKEK